MHAVNIREGVADREAKPSLEGVGCVWLYIARLASFERGALSSAYASLFMQFVIPYILRFKGMKQSSWKPAVLARRSPLNAPVCGSIRRKQCR